MHEHKTCEHKNLKYCSKCDVVYCEDCKKEWGSCSSSWTYTPYLPYYSDDGSGTYETTATHIHII